MNKQIAVFRRMVLIRTVEETIAERYSEERMRCPTHLSIGQEAVAAAAGLAVGSCDYAVSTHRGHAHYLGKGGDVGALIAELYGKVGGCSRGRGGSMHLVDQSVGFMGSTAIVGNSIPVGVGLGLACQLEGTGRLSVVFLGEGAVEQGVFYESANVAAVRSLPVLFVCENNLYSVYSPLAYRQPEGRRIHEMVEAIGIPGMWADGNDADASLQVLEQAVSEIRSGRGPRFVELETYRWREHCGPNYDNDLGYRSAQEFEAWEARDPVVRYGERLSEEGILDAGAMDEVTRSTKMEVDEAFAFAESSPFPDASEADIGEYFERRAP